METLHIFDIRMNQYEMSTGSQLQQISQNQIMSVLQICSNSFSETQNSARLSSGWPMQLLVERSENQQKSPLQKKIMFIQTSWT